MSFAEIGASALRAGEPLAVTATPGETSVPHSLAAAAADVEVDMETGAVACSGSPRWWPADRSRTSGRPPRRSRARSSPPSSRRSWAAAPSVTALDVPPLAVTFVPGGDPLSRFGTAAHAEAAGRAALAALANAIARASGTRLRTLPLDPPRLLAAMDDMGKRR